ncbi:uncharacterized protein ISCGN_015553 [Ixodes scapularis]
MAGSQKRLYNYASHLHRRCPGVPPAKRLCRSLCQTKSIVSESMVNYDLTCKDERPSACQLVNNLSVWNEFLWLVDAELKEVVPGRLALVTLNGDVWPHVSNVQSRHISVLIHWLLAKHQCIETLELRETVIPSNPSLFCDALRENQGLRHLKLCAYHLDDSVTKCLIRSIGSMPLLETLELKSVRLQKMSLATLREVLKTTKALRVLSLTHIVLLPDSVTSLLQSLKCVTSLEVLHLDDNFLRPGKGTVLGAFLEDHDGITEFSLTQTLDETTFKVSPVIRSLKKSAMKRMHLVRFALSRSDLLVLQDILETNTSLQYLRVVFSNDQNAVPCAFADLVQRNMGLKELVLEQGSLSCDSVSCFADVLVNNSNLKTLELPHCTLEATDAIVLVGALDRNNSLDKLVLGSIRCSTGTDLSHVLAKTNCCKRVQCTFSFNQISSLTLALQSGSGMSSILFHSRDEVDPRDLQRLFAQLCCSPSLTELSLRLFQCIDDDTARHLQRLLATTKTLKSADLDFATELSSTQILLKGLQRNRGLSTLKVRRWMFGSDEAELLKSVLSRNRALTRLSFQHQANDSNATVTVALAQCLDRNCTLLRVKTREDRELELFTFRIRDALRRNLTLFHKALKFVLGWNQKHLAAAFEKVCGSDALVEKVMELEGDTNLEAKQRIKCRDLYLRTHFFQITRVVNNKLECVRTGLGGVSLDQLGWDCLLRILSYLSVSDVRSGYG